MENETELLYRHEFGQYLKVVSAAQPIGVCTRCLILRSRHDVDAKERCPADILQKGLENAAAAAPHSWQRFTDKKALEEYLAQNYEHYRAMTQEIQRLAEAKSL